MYTRNKPKKSLGQNFLIDKNIINKIVDIVNVSKNESILEIGPGLGSLTSKIIKINPKSLLTIEKDKVLTDKLRKKFINYKNIEIINEDILNILEKKDFGKNIIVFGNLPYNISTKIIATLVLTRKWPPWYKMLIFMFQKEVAERIIAKDHDKNYGRLAILCKWRLDVKKHFNITRNCFYPKPKVDSTILSFKPKKNVYKIKNPKNLETVTRILFSNRRKMINKNFIKLFKGKVSIANDLNLDLEKRPEEISSEMFYKITVKYEELFG